MTEFYNITTGRITDFPSVINGRGGNQYPRDWEAARQAGLRILHRADPTPEGYVRIAGPTYTCTDTDATEHYEIITIAEYEAQQAAREAERIAALAQQYGQKVGLLVGLLAIFDVTMPTTQAEATPKIYAKTKLDPLKMPDAMLTFLTYQELVNVLPDADIYAISQIINQG